MFLAFFPLQNKYPLAAGRGGLREGRQGQPGLESGTPRLVNSMPKSKTIDCPVRRVSARIVIPYCQRLGSAKIEAVVHNAMLHAYERSVCQYQLRAARSLPAKYHEASTKHCAMLCSYCKRPVSQY
eukprot:3676123-Rhodomonas_salina.2